MLELLASAPPAPAPPAPPAPSSCESAPMRQLVTRYSRKLTRPDSSWSTAATILAMSARSARASSFPAASPPPPPPPPPPPAPTTRRCSQTSVAACPETGSGPRAANSRRARMARPRSIRSRADRWSICTGATCGGRPRRIASRWSATSSPEKPVAGTPRSAAIAACTREAKRTGSATSSPPGAHAGSTCTSREFQGCAIIMRLMTGGDTLP
mmetsp:Transcript_1339/g.3862  ORF Transcript_1339/g.3862 Transcript_1339/m.3862 type:complete len:212 (-) Transcript_1339:862-1497(-)